MLDKNLILDLARFYSVKVVFKKNLDSHARVDLSKDIIFLKDEHISTEELLTFFFHEYSHLICKYTNKFPLFHGDEKKLTKTQQSSFLRTIWRAEVYVDKLGKKMMNNHFPSLKYQRGYTSKTKRIFKDLLVQEYREYFNYLNNR